MFECELESRRVKRGSDIILKSSVDPWARDARVRASGRQSNCQAANNDTRQGDRRKKWTGFAGPR